MPYKDREKYLESKRRWYANRKLRDTGNAPRPYARTVRTAAMKAPESWPCPQCKSIDLIVIDSRYVDSKATIRRRRKCQRCGNKFTTQEVTADYLESLQRDLVAANSRVETLRNAFNIMSN